MKLIGIDYGTKRIGLATGRTEDGIAFPFVVVENSLLVASMIADIVSREDIEKIVLGESRQLDGTHNQLHEEVAQFARELEEKTGLPLVFENEVYSTQQAMRIQGKNKQIDASAAAVILQAYLDRTAHDR